MHPWLLYHPPVTTYGACIVAGLLLAWLFARRNARLAAVDPSRIDLMVPLLIATGLLGAYAFGGLAESLAPSNEHGTVLLGCLLLATVSGIVYALGSRVGLGLLGDISAAPVALGVACGRVGCFLAGCCYGQPCADHLPHVAFRPGSFAWNAQLTDNLIEATAASSLAVHPVQLYEAALCLLLALALAARFRRRTISGERFLFLRIGYAAIRFPLEFLRADNPPIALHLTFSQWICLLLVPLCVATLLVRRRWATSLHLRLAPAGS